MALKDEIGVFAWFSLMTNDPVRATAFYGEVFGWTASEFEIPNMGKVTIYSTGGRSFGGPVPLEADQSVPGHWISYIAVADVDEACELAESLGGRVCVPAFDIPTIGRTAVINDPLGTAFHVFTPHNKDDDLRMTGDQPGQICWMELMVDQPQDVIPFYSRMFTWTVSEPMQMNASEYYSLSISGNKSGGFMKRPPQAPAMLPVWIPYVAVTAIDDTNQRVQERGGNVLMPKKEIPATGFFSLIEDPTGAHIYAFEFNM